MKTKNTKSQYDMRIDHFKKIAAGYQRLADAGVPFSMWKYAVCETLECDSDSSHIDNCAAAVKGFDDEKVITAELSSGLTITLFSFRGKWKLAYV